MNRSGRSFSIPKVVRYLPLIAILGGIGPVLAGCGGGSPAPVNPPPSSAHAAAEQAAVANWLKQTNQMWTDDNFAALDQITTAGMRTIYQSEKPKGALPGTASRPSFQLTSLSVTVPCHSGTSNVFVAYGDTNVFDLGQATQPTAMVFERVDGAWKLAAAISRPDGGWPALCTQGAPPTTPALLTPADYPSVLARVLTHAMTGTAQTSATASPFAVNDFLAGVRQPTQARPPGRRHLPRRLHPGPLSRAGAAAGQRQGILGDRLPRPARYLRFACRASRQVLAGRQPGRHAASCRRPS
jgi:hypothetical protein